MSKPDYNLKYQTSSNPSFPNPKNPRYTFNYDEDNRDKFCSKCKRPISRTANFCQWCGEKQLSVLVADVIEKYLKEQKELKRKRKNK